MVVLAICLLLGVAFFGVKVVAKPLLVLQRKPPPEASKTPVPPKLTKKVICLGVKCPVAALRVVKKIARDCQDSFGLLFVQI